MRDDRPDIEVLEGLGYIEPAEQARLVMGLAPLPIDTPVRRLQRAILTEALYDALDGREKAVRWRASALAWIAASYDDKNDTADLSTFEGCCTGLGIDPDRVRVLVASTPPSVTSHRKWLNRLTGSMTKVCSEPLKGPRCRA